jgi:nitrite reductase/ring-hydroxylating ferredoxin subunit
VEEEEGPEAAMSQFVSVAEVASLERGQGRTVHADGREFAVWNDNGEFFCMDDLCPHRGGPLGAGFLKDGEVACPLHGWTFDVRTGACASRPDRPVRMYPTRVLGGQIQILI